MTKRDLINLLEASPLSDDTEVMKSSWYAPDDGTGCEEWRDIYDVCSTSTQKEGWCSYRSVEDKPVIVL